MNADATDQMYREIALLIRRYGRESDVSTYEIIATLEIVKYDLIEQLGEMNKKKKEGDGHATL